MIKLVKLKDCQGATWWINPEQVKTIRFFNGSTQLTMGGDQWIDFNESPEELVREIEVRQLPKYKQEVSKRESESGWQYPPSTPRELKV
jgi:uncharacterized protein YlzI (FlbEa/FlbD family)